MGAYSINTILTVAVLILSLSHRTAGGSWRNLERKLSQDYHSSNYYEDKNRIHFPDEIYTERSWYPDTIPRDEESQHQCLSSCPGSKEYSPVCGTNSATYENMQQLHCAMVCGIDVQLYHRSPCVTEPPVITTSRPPVTTPATTPEQESCIRSCPTTPEYNPVCGTNYVTYNNIGKLECAKYCGVGVQLWRYSRCPNYIVSTKIQPTTTTSEGLDVEIQNCISNCPVTSQYDPVCATNNVTYYNIGKLECAKACGVGVNFKSRRPCSLNVESEEYPNYDHFDPTNYGEDYDGDVDMRYPDSSGRSFSFK